MPPPSPAIFMDTSLAGFLTCSTAVGWSHYHGSCHQRDEDNPFMTALRCLPAVEGVAHGVDWGGGRPTLGKDTTII